MDSEERNLTALLLTKRIVEKHIEYENGTTVLIKELDGEMYIFAFGDDLKGEREILRQIGRWVANTELNFTLHAAAAVCQHVKVNEAKKVLERQISLRECLKLRGRQFRTE